MNLIVHEIIKDEWKKKNIHTMDEIIFYLNLGLISFPPSKMTEEEIKEEQERINKKKNEKLKMTNKHNERKIIINYLRNNVFKELIDNRLHDHPRNCDKFDDWGF
jgi:hypothetical protein